MFFVILSAAAIYAAEATPAGFAEYKPELIVKKAANEYVVTWHRLPYLSYYEVEVLSSPPANDQTPARLSDKITRYRTWSNHWTVNQSFPYHTYWRVSAQGLFSRPIGRYSETLSLNDWIGASTVDFKRIKPTPTSFYPNHRPAPVQPVLTWTSVPGAVYYELEFLSQMPENPNDILPSHYRLWATREVYTNGYNADLSPLEQTRLFWRTRALDYHGNPLGTFSDAVELYFNPDLQLIPQPVITATINQPETAPLLYPVYSWIPIAGATSYEVELLSQPPENPEGIEPSRYRLWNKQVTAPDCYDDLPRMEPGYLYWRVRGLDSQGDPVGVYSQAVSFPVDWGRGRYAATFGDSITHGGGAVSYSPANREYSYQTYLRFPVVNLGRSGDTAETLAARFEQDVLPVKPKYLLIMGGTNSIRSGVPASDVIRDLTTIRNKCLANGIRPIFLTLPPINPAAIERVFQEGTTPEWKKELTAVNRFLRQQPFCIDIEPHLTGPTGELPDYYAVDGLHLDIEGKKLIAQIVNVNWSRVTR